MTYTYECQSCKHRFDLALPMSKRDEPLRKSCPKCRARRQVHRVIATPGISYDGVVSDIRRAGSGWNDVLKRIDRYAGKKSTVDHY